jgi:hypothetical protein
MLETCRLPLHVSEVSALCSGKEHSFSEGEDSRGAHLTSPSIGLYLRSWESVEALRFDVLTAVNIWIVSSGLWHRADWKVDIIG